MKIVATKLSTPHGFRSPTMNPPQILQRSLAAAGVLLAMQLSSAFAYKFPPLESNVSYGPHAHESFDVFVPATGTAPYPVVICFGGLWKSGKDRESPMGSCPWGSRRSQFNRGT